MSVPNNNKKSDSKTVVRHILKLSEDIFRATKLSVPPEWLSSDMTIAQLRVLLLLHAEGPSRMGSIAASISTTLPTATGIVDNLVKKELVTRGADPEDRRLVICELSHQGQETINLMWTLGQFQLAKLLRGLSLEELEKSEEVAEILLRNVTASVNNA
jgi:DNA-binding MarR family transcriptional regulator